MVAASSGISDVFLCVFLGFISSVSEEKGETARLFPFVEGQRERDRPYCTLGSFEQLLLLEGMLNKSTREYKHVPRELKETVVGVRATETRKALFEQAAQREGMTLSEWMRQLAERRVAERELALLREAR